ncbi:MAG: hypothetical protein ABJA67_09080 [Chthonomonadales bacterium]
MLFVLLFVLTAVCAVAAIRQATILKVGKQPDGSFIVSTEQHIEGGAMTIGARPIDMAYRPGGGLLAVLCHHSVVLATKEGVQMRSFAWLGHGAGFRGITWSPDGNRLFASVADGYVQEMALADGRLVLVRRIRVKPLGDYHNPRPGGMVISKDGHSLFVALCDRNSVVEIDLTTDRRIREFNVQNLPFEIKLSDDEKTLVVTNWGGRKVTDDDERGETGNATIAIDSRGAAASGTVSLIDRETGDSTNIDVGLHPTAIGIRGDNAYITNSGSDSISVIDLASESLVRTMPIRYGSMNFFGSMPCAIAIKGNTGYICDGGDNAVCEMDLDTGRVRGFRPVGYFPIAIAISRTGKLIVLNTKGNGSVTRTQRGLPGNVHDFEGTISMVDLTQDLKAATLRVSAGNGWTRDRTALNPPLKVYRGAIKHVIYVIKENRSYDEVLGDIPTGNGDPKLCFLGENITPNHHAIAREFTLFDNAYATGTNSADGHQWCTQALANDYIEHFYSGYRAIAFDGACSMAISNSGCIWDAALKKGRKIRVYGEFCDSRLATFNPPVRRWTDIWNDRISGKHAITARSKTRIAALKPFINSKVVCWPLLQSDQERADQFIAEYSKFSKADRVPNLMIMTLPCDHTEGRNPYYPTPKAMVADNDYALGRIFEAVSKSPQWKETCIMVIEDDAQFGRDHVDGHRTVFYALSPYTRRGHVDKELCNTVSMVRSIELMLGLDPMNRFDAVTPPLADCFTNTPNLAPYTAFPNRIPLDQMNLPLYGLKGEERRLTEESMALDWSDIDRPDPKMLSRILWASR